MGPWGACAGCSGFRLNPHACACPNESLLPMLGDSFVFSFWDRFRAAARQTRRTRGPSSRDGITEPLPEPKSVTVSQFTGVDACTVRSLPGIYPGEI
jgi:hypothetical protein